MAKIIVLFSTKGGVGKTLISTNIAFAISEQKKKVLLIDADVDAVGDAARILDLEQGRSLADAMYLLKKNKEFKINEFIRRHPEGLDFIPAAGKVRQISQFDSDLIKPVFDLFRDNYDYIVIDGGRAFSQSLVRLFEEANLLLLIVTPDILSVYQTKWALDTLQSLFFPLKMIKIIVNRAESLASISLNELKTNLPCEIILNIPSQGEIAMLSINKKTPLVKSFPRSKIASGLREFAKNTLNKKEIFLEHKEIEEIKIDIKERLQGLGKQKTTAFGDIFQESHFIDKKEEDEMIILKQKMHKRLIEELDLRRIEISAFSDSAKIDTLKEKAQKLLADFLAEETNALVGSVQVRQKLIGEMIDEVLGLGPLEDFLRDPQITDIMVNNKNEVYIEKGGKVELTSKRFVSNDQVRTIIERIIAPLGRHIDESIPMVDARLPDGSRVNAIIPPLSLSGPTLTIRKFRKERFKLEELIDIGTLDKRMGEFLKGCVSARKNIIVSGGTGSGKTSLLNILSSFIPDDERIITIEDAAELKLEQTHWVRLESRPASIEGRGDISIRELFRNSLRMRPDRIVIGECRGVETLDMLQAMNTGHDGSMTTVHANSTQDVLSRLDSLILISGLELPIRAIKEMIASAVDLIVHTARLSDGSRKVVQITEVVGLLDELHVNLKDIFIFQRKGIDNEKRVIGDFKPTGYIPVFFEDLAVRGINISKDIFQP
ncbi:MAG: ATPase, T2SS/T4P/T4SS family [bacterium]